MSLEKYSQLKNLHGIFKITLRKNCGNISICLLFTHYIFTSVRSTKFNVYVLILVIKEKVKEREKKKELVWVIIYVRDFGMSRSMFLKLSTRHWISRYDKHCKRKKNKIKIKQCTVKFPDQGLRTQNPRKVEKLQLSIAWLQPEPFNTVVTKSKPIHSNVMFYEFKITLSAMYIKREIGRQYRTHSIWCNKFTDTRRCWNKSKVGDLSRGRSEGYLFNSYNTEM